MTAARELIVDAFAGGGGASEGIRLALGRSPDIAINHDAEAIALHAANHPEATHYQENAWRVDPVAATDGRPVGLMWLSPDCKHFSKAKGGKPVSKRVRGLAWIAVRWAQAVRPRVIMLENVEEFQTWGPVLADGRPCPARRGATFRAFVRRLERLGYAVEWRVLRACDYGAPTIRRRLFVVARCDGAPIVWPTPTHGRGRLPYRTAAECIDWSIPCPSISARKKPLAVKTLRRIAAGLTALAPDREHLHAAGVRAFLVAYYGTEKDSDSPFDPMRTVTSKDRLGLVTVAEQDDAIADIGMRMLTPRELYRAQGFGEEYRIEIPYRGTPMTKTAQVRMCGNSVCPPLAEAIVRANYATAQREEVAA